MSKFNSYRKEIRFFIYFIFLFFALQALHYIARPHIKPFVVNYLTTGGSSRLINLMTPGENTRTQEEYLISGSFKLKIARGCEGIEGVIILLAAILAFPASIKFKSIGVIVGIFVIYGLNLFRVAGLYYTLKYKPGLFDMMHIYVGQTLIILVAFLYFIIWLTLQVRLDGKSR